MCNEHRGDKRRDDDVYAKWEKEVQVELQGDSKNTNNTQNKHNKQQTAKNTLFVKDFFAKADKLTDYYDRVFDKAEFTKLSVNEIGKYRDNKIAHYKAFVIYSISICLSMCFANDLMEFCLNFLKLYPL